MQISLVPQFATVPRQSDKGWTVDIQRRFVAALAATGSVTIAARHVGLSRQSAYILRAAVGSEEFREAWDAAIGQGISALKAVAFDRAINGEEVAVWHNGEQVGTRRHYNNQLIMRLLTHYDRQDGSGGKDDGFAVPVSAENVRTRVDSHLMWPDKQRQMTEADYRRNGEWGAIEQFRAHLRHLEFVWLVRRWLAEKPGQALEILERHLDHWEQEARGHCTFTDAMIDEVLTTGRLRQPWLESAHMAILLEKAEYVEASAFLIK